MELNFKFTQNLISNQRSKVIELFHQVKEASFEQHPDFAELANSQKTISYGLAWADKELISYAIIVERFRQAKRIFGPVCKKDEVQAELIHAIHDYYKK